LRAGEGNVVFRPAAMFTGHCRPQARLGVEAAADVPRDVCPEEDHLQTRRHYELRRRV
jgi:hypothetical protein